jgi:hypothetical protein
MDAPGGLVRATAQIQFDAAPAATDVITIGEIAYTYIATPASAYDVDVGADLTASVLNLVAAINKSGGGATTYYETGTLVNPHMSAATAATNQILLTARVPGTAGNGIYLLSSETDIDIEEVGDTATLFSTAGTGVLEDALISLLDEVQLNSEAISMIAHLTARSTD